MSSSDSSDDSPQYFVGAGQDDSSDPLSGNSSKTNSPDNENGTNHFSIEDLPEYFVESVHFADAGEDDSPDPISRHSFNNNSQNAGNDSSDEDVAPPVPKSSGKNLTGKHYYDYERAGWPDHDSSHFQDGLGGGLRWGINWDPKAEYRCQVGDNTFGSPGKPGLCHQGAQSKQGKSSSDHYYTSEHGKAQQVSSSYVRDERNGRSVFERQVNPKRSDDRFEQSTEGNPGLQAAYLQRTTSKHENMSSRRYYEQERTGAPRGSSYFQDGMGGGMLRNQWNPKAEYRCQVGDNTFGNPGQPGSYRQSSKTTQGNMSRDPGTNGHEYDQNKVPVPKNSGRNLSGKHYYDYERGGWPQFDSTEFQDGKGGGLRWGHWKGKAEYSCQIGDNTPSNPGQPGPYDQSGSSKTVHGTNYYHERSGGSGHHSSYLYQGRGDGIRGESQWDSRAEYYQVRKSYDRGHPGQ